MDGWSSAREISRWVPSATPRHVFPCRWSLVLNGSTRSYTFSGTSSEPVLTPADTKTAERCERSVGCDQNGVLENRLSREHSIERIAVRPIDLRRNKGVLA